MRILDSIRKDRQTVLFSATFPRQMEAVARKVLLKPVEIQVGGRSVVCSDVEQHAVVLESDNRFFKLLELLGVYQEKGEPFFFYITSHPFSCRFTTLRDRVLHTRFPWFPYYVQVHKKFKISNL